MSEHGSEFIALVERLSALMQEPERPEVELTKLQRRALHLLSGGPQRMNEIAGGLGVSVSAVTSLVDRLVAKGLVERAGDPADRRVVLCRLTDSGLDEAERQVQLFREVAADLSDAELEAVMKGLTILAGAIARRGRADSRPRRRPATGAGGGTRQ